MDENAPFVLNALCIQHITMHAVYVYLSVTDRNPSGLVLSHLDAHRDAPRAYFLASYSNHEAGDL